MRVLRVEKCARREIASDVLPRGLPVPTTSRRDDCSNLPEKRLTPDKPRQSARSGAVVAHRIGSRYKRQRLIEPSVSRRGAVVSRPSRSRPARNAHMHTIIRLDCDIPIQLWCARVGCAPANRSLARTMRKDPLAAMTALHQLHQFRQLQRPNRRQRLRLCYPKVRSRTVVSRLPPLQ